MIEVPVKTLFKGMVAIHQKYAHKAYDGKVPLEIKHAGQSMTLEGEAIRTRIVQKSIAYLDKFTKEPYRLYYYMWRPNGFDIEQDSATTLVEDKKEHVQGKLF